MNPFKLSKEELIKKSDLIRKEIIKMTVKAKEGHLTPALSITEILTTLYFRILNYDTDMPKLADRDRLVLSKGHGCAALYVTLCEAGFFPKDLLSSFAKCDTALCGHPDAKKAPGIDVSTGSLGHGLSIAVGMALAGRTLKKNYRIFAIMGDGEQQEGEVWEAGMSASHYQLDHLVGIIDRNRLQAVDRTDNVMNIEPLEEKWKSFGWAVKIIDGHSIEQLTDALENIPLQKNKPSMIIANTVKGKGVPLIEDSEKWHYGVPSQEYFEKELKMKL